MFILNTSDKEFDDLINSDEELEITEREMIEDEFHIRVSLLISELDEKDEIIEILCAPIKKYTQNLLTDRKISHPFGSKWYDVFVVPFIPSKYMLDESVRLRVRIILNLCKKIKIYQTEQTIIALKDVIFTFKKASCDLDAQSISRFIAELNKIVEQEAFILEKYEIFKRAKTILYHEQAAKNNDYQSIKQLLLLDNSLATADQWCNLGEDYYYAKNNRSMDYLKSAACFEIALTLDPNHVRALYMLGWQYQYGQGVSEDIVGAKVHYKIAAGQNYELSIKQLLILENTGPLSVESWCNLGDRYYYGKEGKVVDYRRALICYTSAKDINPNKARVLFCLGQMYQHGHEVRRDTSEAKKLYQKSLEQQKGYSPSIKQLLILDNPNFNIDANNPNPDAAKKWNKLAQRHYKSKNYIRARLCFEFTIINEPDNEIARFHLAAIYENGYGVAIDCMVANKHYEHLRRFGAKYRQQLKKIERKLIVARYQASNNYLHEKDEKGNTILHRAAKGLRLKNCARLLFLGANKDQNNADGRKPFSDLSYEQMKKVERLQTQVSNLIAELEKEPSDILIGKFSIDNASMEKVEVKEKLDTIYKIDQIKPLMDLAKLAALGLHNLSRRKKYKENGYDSDNDDEEKLDGQENLNIRVDTRNETVQGICHHGLDGQEGKDAVGIYTNANTIFLGGARPRNQVRGTFIHELTHFIAKEVFANDCKPYAENDNDNRTIFEAIANDLHARRNELDPILQAAFRDSYQNNNQVHGELIVRVAQMIVEYPDGLERLKIQTPRLLNYYKNIFLVAVTQHTEKLKSRALSDYPMELFTKDRQNNGFSLQYK